MKDLQLADVLARFAAADSSWLSTVRSDGRPHAAPVWHVWTAGRFFVVTKPAAVKVANIRHNPAVTLTHPDPHAVIIVDGYAAIVEAQQEGLRPFFQAKYDWDIVADEQYNTVIAIKPVKLLAWPEQGAAYRQRWRGAALDGLG